MVFLTRSKSDPIKTNKIYKLGGEWAKFGLRYVFQTFRAEGIIEVIWEMSCVYLGGELK